MAEIHNWFPGKRADALAMAKVWGATLATHAAAWGLPPAELAELGTLTAAAETALDAAMGADRGPVATAECRAAFDMLEIAMRRLKKHRLLEPPLTPPDFITLLLRPPDGVRTEVPAPELEGEGDLKFPDYGIIELRNIRVRGSPSDERPYNAVMIYYGLTGTPSPQHPYRLSEAPESGFQLPYAVRTRRKRHRFEFQGESGNRIYVCVRWQNGKGIEGPWGPILTAIIP